MNKLSFNHNGIKFENPFLLASSPITRNAEMILRGFKLGWGGAVLKTVNLYPETILNLSQRMYGYKQNSSLLGLQNIEMISERSVSDWVDDIKLLKDSYPEKIIVASIMAEGNNIEDWQKLTEVMQVAGADLIELNLSCPNGVPEKGMGSYCSEIPQLCAQIIAGVKQVSKIPVWAKLSPNITNISHLAQCCIEAGADGIAAINTLIGFAGINIKTLEPKLTVDGYSTYGGFSGQIIKPVAMKAVSEIAIDHNCYVTATGGISNWEDCIEFMLLGASSVQICTEVMYRGYGIIKDITENVEKYLETYNYSSLEGIIGLALNKVKSFGSLNNQVKYCANVSQSECRQCGRCLTSCQDAGYQAISHNSKGKYLVSHEKCVGCGLCQYVCPFGAIKMSKTPSLSLIESIK